MMRDCVTTPMPLNGSYLSLSHSSAVGRSVVLLRRADCKENERRLSVAIVMVVVGSTIRW
jgi:hypothetical protein